MIKKAQFLYLVLVVSLTLVSPLSAEVSVTIYNQDLALVRETRQLEVQRGVVDISFTDVAARIIPTSVHFSAEGVALLEQNFEFDLIESHKLLDKFIDHEIEVYTEDQSLHRGTLLSANGDIVLQSKDGMIHTLKSGFVNAIDYPQLPDGLYTRPTLVWKVDAARTGKVDSEISYLTRGISWEAEYVALVGENDDELELTGWVNIDNKTGATFKVARLKLMAGDVNIERDRGGRDFELLASSYGARKAEPQFSEEAFYEYHLYTLQRPSTLQNRQIKQISLFPAAEVENVHKEYRYDAGNNKKVEVNLKFKNSKENGLAIPLPKGIVRVYKESKTGGSEFIGEDRIDHTPANEKLTIHTGKAFDIVGETTVVNRDQRGRTTIQDVKIVLRNHKKETVEVVVEERFRTNWNILRCDPSDYEKISANQVEWKVKVKPEQERVITYTVQWD